MSHSANYYNDVIMGATASQITSLVIIYSTVYSDADERKHQSSASLAWEFTVDRWIPCRNNRLRGKSFHLMTSSWYMHKLCAWVRMANWAQSKYRMSKPCQPFHAKYDIDKKQNIRRYFCITWKWLWHHDVFHWMETEIITCGCHV